MAESDSNDPYEILGVTRDASLPQIKSAYRKLALRYHPDKQKNDEDRAKSSEVFTKIGNAYEILSDEGRRSEYDQGTPEEESYYAPRSSSRRHHHHHDPFSDPFLSPFGDDSFFGRSRRSASTSSSGSGGGSGGARRGFADPFDIFEQVFGEEFTGNRSAFGGRSMNGFSSDIRHSRDPFQDPFFSSPGFGGFGMMDHMMSNMNQHMEMMHAMQQQQQASRGNGGHNGRHGSYMSSYSSSSSSSNMMNGGGIRESVSTTTRIVNGKRQTVTERVVTRPDGKVERHVETSGDEDFPVVAGQIQAGDNSNETLARRTSRSRKKRRGDP